MTVEKKAAIGVAWMTSARMAVRILGLVSTLALARLLVPADFGLVAIATVVASGLELLTLFNFDMALLQTSKVTRAHYDSAWSLNVALGAMLAGLLVALSWAVADFYGDARLNGVMWAVAAKYLIDSACNPGTVDFRRALDFRPDFYLQVVPKVAGVVPTLALAWWLQDYRALLAGILITSGAGCVLSYALHPHRPRWCVSEARTLMNFSRWLLLNNLVGFLRTRGADLIIGRALGPAALGIYTVAYEVSNLPSSEMVAPVNRVLFPSYVHMAGDTDRLRAWFRASLGAINLVILPICFGIAALSEPLVYVLLGSKWVEAIPLVTVLAIAGAGMVPQATTGSVYNALGQPKLIALTGAIHAAVVLPLVWYATYAQGLYGVSWAILIYSWGLGLAATYVIFLRSTPVTLSDVVTVSLRPLLGSAAMYCALLALNETIGRQTTVAGHLLHLLLGAVSGAAIYLLAVAALWLASGRPAGSESLVLGHLRRLRS